MFSSFHVFLCINFLSIFLSHQVSSDEVPVITWNVKGNVLQIQPVPALVQHDNIFDAILKNILREKANILIFSVKSLSSEDFSSMDTLSSPNNTLQTLQTYLETQRYMYLKSVKNPLNRVHEMHCGVQEIIVDHSIDDNVLNSISQSLDRSCVIILHISDTSVVGVKDPKPADIKRVFQPSFKKTSKDIVGMFTALRSSWGHSSDEHHIMRNLLATAEETEVNFLNVSGCLLMYSDNATLTLKKQNISIPLPFPPDTEGSECGNTTALLQLKFTPDTEYTSVTIKFNFTARAGSWTTTSFIEAESEKGTGLDEKLNSKDLQAAVDFSFSCGTYELTSINSSSIDIVLSFDRFQVQPFKVDQKFSDSFDCVTWFTVPIWMGIFVTILFVTIINVGIYALFSVHTMDRFDDPKGKTISVAIAAE